MKRLFLLFVAILMASTGMWAQTKNVTYRYPVYYSEGDAASGIKEWKTARVDATLVQGSESTAVLGADDTETWYVVTEGRLLMKNGLDIKGTVNLIICDYDTLVVKTMEKRPAIDTGGATLVIYGQTAGNGTLIADGGKVGVGESDGPAGIGGRTNASGGTVIINGDSVAVTSTSGGAAIGGGFCGNGGTVIINNGKVVAKSDCYGAGIGGGRYGSGGTVIINGGLVTAKSQYGAGIGGGSSSTEDSSGHNHPVYGGTVTINGGTMTATGAGSYGVGIGAGGRNGIGANLTINGGNVTVEVGNQGGGVCIGGQRSDDSVMTTITNGAIKFVGTPLNNNNTIATRANISGGIFSYVPQEEQPQKEWLQEGCVVLQNEDTSTKNEYPWKVVHTGEWETVTYGDNIAVSPAFTSGSELPADTQITFTAIDRTASGYEFAGFYKESTYDTPITTGVSGQTYTVTVMDAPISVYAKYVPLRVSTTYIDEKGVSQNIYAYVVTDATDKRVTWGEADKETWYIVTGEDVRLLRGAVCQGDVNLILADGAKLTAMIDFGLNTQIPAGIQVSGEGNSLTIYGQANQSGKLEAKGLSGAGIGGSFGDNGSNITINGGNVTAQSLYNGAGIGGGCNGHGKDIFVATNLIVKAGVSEQSATVIENNGGDLAENLAGKRYVTIEPKPAVNVSYIDAEGVSHNINAYAVTDATDAPVTWGTAGKETWYVVAGTDVRLSNGAVCQGDVNLILADGAKLTATGDATQAGICVSGTGNSLTIYGQTYQSGQLIAIGNSGAGIGGNGEGGEGSNITINGGIVMAQSLYNGAGIGGGSYGKGSNITINGGKVTAIGFEGDGIGGGVNGYGKDVFVATNLIVKAGASDKSVTVIENTGGDLAGSLAGKRYVTITEDIFNITANQDPDDETHYYSTFYSSTNAYKVPEGVTAYTGKVDGDVLKLTSIANGIIPAGEAVILRLTTEDNTATKKQFALTATTTTATKSTDNKLSGTDAAKTLEANQYALSLGQKGVGFYLWEGKSIGAHKAYLTLPASSAKAFTFQFEDETDGIHSINVNDSSTGSETGDNMYNLNGVRVNNGYKGIVIVNGKKVIK